MSGYDRTTVNFTPEQRAFLKVESARTNKSMKEIVHESIELYRKEKEGEKVTELYLADIERKFDEMLENLEKYIHDTLFSAFYSSVKTKFAEIDRSITTTELMVAKIASELEHEDATSTYNKYREVAKKHLQNQDKKKSKERF